MSTDHAVDNMPKRERIFNLMKDLAWHSHHELRRVGGVRYGARLLELKRLGYEIDDRSLRVQGKEYRLVSQEKGVPKTKKVKVYLEKEQVEELLNGTVSAEARIEIERALASFMANEHKL